MARKHKHKSSPVRHDDGPRRSRVGGVASRPGGTVLHSGSPFSKPTSSFKSPIADSAARRVKADRLAVLNALRAEHDRRVAAGISAPSEKSRRNVSRLNISDAGTKLDRKDRDARRSEPVKKDRHDEKVRDDLHKCKKRPDPRRGHGSGGKRKKFIPWC